LPQRTAYKGLTCHRVNHHDPPTLRGVLMLRRCFVALLVTAALAVSARAQATLKWELKKGDQFYIKTVSNTKQSLKIQGQKEIKQPDTEQTVVLGFKVEDKSADGIVFKETVEELTFKAAGGEPQSFTAIEGATFTVTLSPKGEITKFEGHDDL